MRGSKYEDKTHNIEVDSNCYMCCVESNNKKNRRIHINPNLIIRDKTLIIIKHRIMYYEPIIDPLRLSFDLEWPKICPCNIFKHANHPKLCPTCKNRSRAENHFIEFSL